MMKCALCGYVINKCTKGHEVSSAHPLRFSAEDKYGKYRRMAKRKGFINR
ncbi:MAG: ribosome biogenesis protein [Candidatus Aenigmarchaeota archaeon]|nr:ribosome biogenesis protein [Candidatus Aenigmarchaeota archaeon]